MVAQEYLPWKKKWMEIFDGIQNKEFETIDLQILNKLGIEK